MVLFRLAGPGSLNQETKGIPQSRLPHPLGRVSWRRRRHGPAAIDTLRVPPSPPRRRFAGDRSGAGRAGLFLEGACVQACNGRFCLALPPSAPSYVAGAGMLRATGCGDAGEPGGTKSSLFPIVEPGHAPPLFLSFFFLFHTFSLMFF